ncbi:MAG: hypothetical protein ACTSWY_04665 [Promethearchaeota archaeon]
MSTKIRAPFSFLFYSLHSICYILFGRITIHAIQKRFYDHLGSFTPDLALEAIDSFHYFMIGKLGGRSINYIRYESV